jgi:cell division protein FtsZ
VTQTGLINLDFADVKAIMGNAGTALMASGEASGENRGEEAAKAAISSALLETSIEGATGVLINVTGGADLTLHEVTEAANVISEAVDPSANIIFGAVIHPRLQKELRVTVIATGLRGGPTERGFRGTGRVGLNTTQRLPDQSRRYDSGSGSGEDRPRRDRGYGEDDRGGWRRRPAGSPLSDPDDDIDLPSFMRRPRE